MATVEPCSPLLLQPLPGLAWLAGNPAGLADETPNRETMLGLQYRGQSGTYRRPLDPGSEGYVGVFGAGWRPVGERAGVAGRVSAGTGRSGETALATVSRPHAANPFVVADTTGSDLRGTSVRVEGSGGLALGRWRVGLSLGFAGADTRTIEAPAPRLIRSAAPAVALGVARLLRPGWLVGVHGRWLGRSERVEIFTVAAEDRIYQLEGFGEPMVFNIRSFYSRWLRSREFGGGLSVAAPLGGGRWAAVAEVMEEADRHWNEDVQDSPSDRWDATRTRLAWAWEARNAPRARTFVSVEWNGSHGRARRIGDPEDHFSAREWSATASGGLSRPASSDVRWSVRGQVERGSRARVDSAAHVTDDLDTWTMSFGAWLQYRISPDVEVSVGGTSGWYTPRGQTLNPLTREEAYQRFVGRELMVYASPARAWGVAAGIDWRRRAGAPLRLRVTGSRLAPGESTHPLPLAPEGHRTRWDVSLGVVLNR